MSGSIFTKFSFVSPYHKIREDYNSLTEQAIKWGCDKSIIEGRENLSITHEKEEFKLTISIISAIVSASLSVISKLFSYSTILTGSSFVCLGFSVCIGLFVKNLKYLNIQASSDNRTLKAIIEK